MEGLLPGDCLVVQPETKAEPILQTYSFWLSEWVTGCEGGPGYFCKNVEIWGFSLLCEKEVSQWCRKRNSYRGPKMIDSQGLFPTSPGPAGVKTSPALETRDTVILFLFFSPSLNRSRKWSRSCGSSSGPALVFSPDSDLMFSLTVTSSGLSVWEDRQLAVGQRAVWRHEADLQCVCHPLFLALSILHARTVSAYFCAYLHSVTFTAGL